MNKTNDITRCEWMKVSVGVSFHWTSMTRYCDGSTSSYNEAVKGFDVKRFAQNLHEAGAQHCIFTLTHAEQYLAFPCKTLDGLIKIRTTERDLLGEIMAELEKYGIRFIAYYNHSCNGNDDVEWKHACGYADGIAGNLDVFADNICGIVGEIAKRYGNSLSGWWFDSPYSIDPRGPYNSISCDMGDWQFPWDKLIKSARSGNVSCAVSINGGIGQHFQYSEGTDYCAGESVRIDEPFTPEKTEGLVDHRWITIDNPGWVYLAQNGGAFSSPRFSDETVKAFIADNKINNRMTTFNMEIDRCGNINPNALRQFKIAFSD